MSNRVNVGYVATGSDAVSVFSIKCYELYGIKVFVQLDRRAKTASIVEYDKITGRYKPKKFEFVDRNKLYMDGWIAILRACEYAITEAKKDLQEFEDEETNKMIATIIKLNEIRLGE